MSTPVYKEKNIIFFPETQLTIEIDCVDSISYNANLKTTKHKVETGLPVSDHTIHENDTLSLSGTIASAYEGKSSAPLDIEQKLLERIKKVSKVIIVSKQKTYDNIIIVSFSKSLGSDNSNDLDFTLNFEEIRTATTEVTTKPIKAKIGVEKKQLTKIEQNKTKQNQKNRNQQQNNKGKQGLKKLTDNKKKKIASVVDVGILGETFGGIIR